jgi:hypothetical protein
LLTKPQVALGVWFSYRRQALVRAVLVVLMTLIVSFVVWEAWPTKMWDNLERYTLIDVNVGHLNLAPSALLPRPVSWLIGGLLAWRAHRRHDPVLALLAWLFLTPLLHLYGSLLFFALVAIRLPLLAWIIHLSMWAIYGGAILFVLLFR